MMNCKFALRATVLAIALTSTVAAQPGYVPPVQGIPSGEYLAMTRDASGLAQLYSMDSFGAATAVTGMSSALASTAQTFVMHGPTLHVIVAGGVPGGPVELTRVRIAGTTIWSETHHTTLANTRRLCSMSRSLSGCITLACEGLNGALKIYRVSVTTAGIEAVQVRMFPAPAASVGGVTEGSVTLSNYYIGMADGSGDLGEVPEVGGQVQTYPGQFNFDVLSADIEVRPNGIPFVPFKFAGAPHGPGDANISVGNPAGQWGLGPVGPLGYYPTVQHVSVLLSGETLASLNGGGLTGGGELRRLPSQQAFLGSQGAVIATFPGEELMAAAGVEEFAYFGCGCSTIGVLNPRISEDAAPQYLQPWTVNIVAPMTSGSTMTLMQGADESSYQGSPTPYALPGLAGCFYFAEVSQTWSGPGSSFGSYTIPAVMQLPGSVIYSQWVVQDANGDVTGVSHAMKSVVQ